MPGSVTDLLADVKSNVTQEIIGDGVMLIMPTIDPMLRDLLLGAASVGTEWQRRIGRDWLIRQRFKVTGVAGIVRGGHLNRYQNLYGGTTTNIKGTVNAQNTMFVEAAGNPVADPSKGARYQAFGLSMGLHSLDTNLQLGRPMQEMEALPAVIDDEVTSVLKGHAKNIAQTFANNWYLDPDNAFALSPLGANGTSEGNYEIVDPASGAKYINFFPSEHIIHRFREGQLVDIYDSDLTTRLNDDSGDAVPVYVIRKDPWTNMVTLGIQEGADETWMTSGNIGDEAVVVAADTYSGSGYTGFQGFYGWRHFIKYGASTSNADNRILGNQAITTSTNDYIDIRNWPMFKSGHFDVGGSITEHKMQLYVERMHSAFKPFGYMADTLLMPQGITTEILGRFASQVEYNRGLPAGDGPLRVRDWGYSDEFSFTCNNRRYTGIVSEYFERGQMLFFRRSNNWALVSPPDISGSRGGDGVTDEELPAIIPYRFLLPPINEGRATFPVLKVVGDLAQPTEYVQLPGEIVAQMFPTEQIPGMLLTGIDDDKLFMDHTYAS